MPLLVGRAHYWKARRFRGTWVFLVFPIAFLPSGSDGLGGNGGLALARRREADLSTSDCRLSARTRRSGSFLGGFWQERTVIALAEPVAPDSEPRMGRPSRPNETESGADQWHPPGLSRWSGRLACFQALRINCGSGRSIMGYCLKGIIQSIVDSFERDSSSLTN